MLVCNELREIVILFAFLSGPGVHIVCILYEWVVVCVVKLQCATKRAGPVIIFADVILHERREQNPRCCVKRWQYGWTNSIAPQRDIFAHTRPAYWWFCVYTTSEHSIFGIFAEFCGLELPFSTLCVHNACIEQPSGTLQFNWPLERNRCHRYFNKILCDFYLLVKCEDNLKSFKRKLLWFL